MRLEMQITMARDKAIRLEHYIEVAKQYEETADGGDGAAVLGDERGGCPDYLGETLASGIRGSTDRCAGEQV